MFIGRLEFLRSEDRAVSAAVRWSAVMQQIRCLALILAAVLLTKCSAVAFSATSTAKQVADALSPSLRGRTALITGANTGIGLEAAKALASKGCRVVLCSRDVKAARDAIDTEVRQAGQSSYIVDSPDIVVKQLDLADLDSVASLAADVAKTEQGLDYLVLNAGIMSLPKLERTKEGWERQMAVNHFGHAALVKSLMPMLSKSRIVVLASTAHRFSSDKVVSDVKYEKKCYLPWTAYGDSKMANLLYAKGLAHHLKLDACSVHPGVIKTRLWNQSLINRAFSLFVGDRGVPEGAASTVWACLSPRTDLKGAYIADCAPALPNDLAQSAALRDEVWRVTNEELSRVGF